MFTARYETVLVSTAEFLVQVMHNKGRGLFEWMSANMFDPLCVLSDT